MIVVTHEAIEILTPPKTPFSPESAVDLMRRSRLPRLHDVTEREALDLFGQYVHVIGHDAPSKQPVTLSIGAQQSFLHQRRAPRLAQKT